MRHVTYVANTTGMILQELGHSERMVELGRITGYLHDIGNMHNRKHHGISGANIVYTELRLLGMDLDEICTITTAMPTTKRKSASRSHPWLQPSSWQTKAMPTARG